MSTERVATTDVTPDYVTVHIATDRLDEAVLKDLQRELRQAVDDNPGRPCILDMSRVEFMPSMSLAALIRLRAELHDRHRRLLLATLQPQIREVFTMTRLDRLFELQDDLAAAQRAVRLG